MWFEKLGSQWASPTVGDGWFLGVGGILFLVVMLWSIFWKGMALWKAARAGSKPWFVALLVVNTVGILEILYIYVFSKKTQASNGEVMGSGM